MNENNLSAKDMSDNALNDNKELKGLGGWLIVVGFGLFFSAGMLIYMLWPFSQLLSSDMWAFLTEYQPEVYNDQMKLMLWATLAANGLLLAAYLYLIYLFFKKHYLFPTAYIAIQIAAFIIMVPYTYVFLLLDPTEPIKIFDASFFRSATYTVFWITYMLKSVRVKNTFVEGRNIAM